MYHEGKEIDGARAAEYLVPESGEERNDRGGEELHRTSWHDEYRSLDNDAALSIHHAVGSAGRTSASGSAQHQRDVAWWYFPRGSASLRAAFRGISPSCLRLLRRMHFACVRAFKALGATSWQGCA